MSWRDYYDLLEKYKGHLYRATKEEMKMVAGRNPNDPQAAQRLALLTWKDNHTHNGIRFNWDNVHQCWSFTCRSSGRQERFGAPTVEAVKQLIDQIKARQASM